MILGLTVGEFLLALGGAILFNVVVWGLAFYLDCKLGD